MLYNLFFKLDYQIKKIFKHLFKSQIGWLITISFMCTGKKDRWTWAL